MMRVPFTLLGCISHLAIDLIYKSYSIIITIIIIITDLLLLH